MLTDDLDYQLPESLIATHPADPRDAARLLVIRRATGELEHHHVRDLPGLPDAIRPGDLMVFNQSKVLPALLSGERVGTGGRVSGLYVECPAPGAWRVMLESGGRLREGERVRLADDVVLELVAEEGGGQWLARVEAFTDQTPAILARVGRTPLPPYIRRARRQRDMQDVTDADAQRYNTVYARQAGSVAAPTAGLHFTPGLLDALDQLGVRRCFVTLHVGMGTFAPVRTRLVEEHPIHREWVSVPAATRQALAQTRAAGGRILVVGTTSVRAIESLPDAPAGDPAPDQDFVTDTSLYITPGHDGETPWPYRFTDGLMTNFHLPRSTLLAMVAALPGVGLRRLMDAYRLAVARRYRFYSYGDAMLIV